MEGRDFIFTSLQSWDVTIGSTVKEIAKEISKKNRVLFINSPLDLKSYCNKSNNKELNYRRTVISKGEISIREVNKNLWVLDFPFTALPVQIFPDGFLFDIVNKFNNKRIYREALKTIKKIGFKEYTLFIDNDLYRSFYAAKYLKPQCSIFFYRDHLQKAYWQKHAPRLRPKLCSKSDLVLTNSEAFKELLIEYNPLHTYAVGQGVNLDLFNITKNNTIPEDMHNISQPIIGYTGYLTTLRLDIELMYKVAKSLPAFSFVFVGPEDDLFTRHKIHDLQNAYFLGEKEYQEVPAYIAAFDICINPQIVNQVTNGNYPLKVDEYLAMGKPTVTTKTDFMSLFGDLVWTCNSVEEYIQAFQDAQNTNDKKNIDQRVALAQSHSWENIVEHIYQKIEKRSKE